MKPISWSKRRIRLECQHCAGRMKVEWLMYLSALESGVALECVKCGAHERVKDRRQASLPVPAERRTARRSPAAPPPERSPDVEHRTWAA
jgi:hypothetical protein